ncbi:YlbF family regulator [Ruminococcaceae bacterium OttesenSCG-928-L11]|nr:YlbF family regulator [Ruminococcaceae bacterium OttesenSCG-928-L11]
MDNVINAARSLGKIIQQDDRYTRYMKAQEANEQDSALQQLIEKFHETRIDLNAESGKPEKDMERVKELDAQVKNLYKDIFANPNMVELSDARNDMEYLLNFVNQIVTGSSNGQDPEAIQYAESCGGSCSSCSGCN